MRFVIDGVLRNASDAKVSVLDRGFLYGDAIFETLRTYDGIPFALSDHLERLRRSAEVVAIPMPVPIGQLGIEVEEHVRASGYAECLVRLMLTRGVAGLGLPPPASPTPTRVLLIEELEPPSAAFYRQGRRAITSEIARPSDSAIGAKVANYFASILALAEAQRRGADEVIVARADGEVVEGATSNLFAVQGALLWTPPLEAGILAGITRAYLIEVAGAAGLDVEERRLDAADLARADEVFLTSSVREVIPIVAIDGKIIGSGKPGPVTQRLHEAYRSHVRSLVARQRAR